jgi:hypothetical protein
VTTTIPVDQVKYVKEFQPRLDVDDGWVEQLRTALDRLPPIVVARGNVLVDGYHRWQAHVREGAEFIDVDDLGDMSDEEIFWQAVERNSVAGKQLSLRDKKRIAAQRYERMDPKTAVAELSARLSVDETTVRRWTKDARAALEEQRKMTAWSLWLDCLTHDQIAEHIDTPRPTVTKWLKVHNGQLPEMNIPPGATEDRPWGSVQHFDVWSFTTADKDAGAQSYFGAIPPQMVENLLWLYTDPGDVVVDLFAGSVTTIDVAKRMGRRVWASDIRGGHYSPHLPIHTHDATSGWPDDAPAKAKLVLLDPPYWAQAAGRYSDDPGEMAEMDLEPFYDAWASVLKATSDRAERVAYVISPTQLDDGTVVDHATDMLRVAWDIGYTVERRIIVTYQTQQATGQQVEWARENKRLLKLYRDLVVLRP